MRGNISRILNNIMFTCILLEKQVLFLCESEKYNVHTLRNLKKIANREEDKRRMENFAGTRASVRLHLRRIIVHDDALLAVVGS